MNEKNGFSLLELLVVVAIIGVLVLFYSGALTKAARMAKSTAGGEAFRQRGIINRLDGGSRGTADRSAARTVFHRPIDMGKGETISSTTLFRVRSDREFWAYWHTMIDPGATGPLAFAKNGSLFVKDAQGKRFMLTPIKAALDRAGPSFPVMWDFISRDMSESGTGNLGVNVLYSDGHQDYLTYPGAFPATPLVAELNHRFVSAE